MKDNIRKYIYDECDERQPQGYPTENDYRLQFMEYNVLTTINGFILCQQSTCHICCQQKTCACFFDYSSGFPIYICEYCLRKAADNLNAYERGDYCAINQERTES